MHTLALVMAISRVAFPKGTFNCAVVLLLEAVGLLAANGSYFRPGGSRPQQPQLSLGEVNGAPEMWRCRGCWVSWQDAVLWELGSQNGALCGTWHVLPYWSNAITWSPGSSLCLSQGLYGSKGLFCG